MPAPKRRQAPQTGPRAAANADTKAQDEAMDTSIVVDGVPYKLGDLTLGELAALEDHTGLPMDAISYGSAKVIMFVVYLVRRRTEPGYSLEDAGNIEIRKVSSDRPNVEAVVGGDGPDPTPASSG